MRYDRNHKNRTRRKILGIAAVAMRRIGLRGATVTGVMAEAGLSHGGFYAHFKSKDELAAAALGQAFANTRDALFGSGAGAQNPTAPAVDQSDLGAVIGRYLGHQHRDHAEAGCPLPSLAAEGSREAPAIRDALQKGAADYVAILTARDHGEATAAAANDGNQAWALLSLMVGGMTLARLDPDPARSDQILRACRKAAKEMLG